MNIIAFERGKSPKEGLTIGVEAMKKKHRILVIKTEFRDVEVAGNSLFNADAFGTHKRSTTEEILNSYFTIIANDREFRIIKMRFAPAHSEMSPSSVIDFVTNWNYPIKRLNDCIVWMAEESEKWNRTEDDYGFKL